MSHPPGPGRPRARSILIAILILIAGLFLVGLLDPNRAFIDSSGHFTLHGRIPGALLDYLLHGPPVPKEWTFVHAEGGSGTMSIRVENVPIPSVTSTVSPTVTITIGRTPSLRELLGYLVEPLRLVVVWVMNQVTDNASAATVTWNGLGVDNNWSTLLNWSTGTPLEPAAVENHALLLEHASLE